MSLGIPRLIFFDKERGMGIIACNNRNLEYVRLALSSIEQVNGNAILAHVVKVTGSRKKAKAICSGIPAIKLPSEI